MIFEIYRTSGTYEYEKPCRMAKQVEGTDTWLLEVNTLEDLFTLMKEEKHSIVLHNWDSFEYPMIEIYDSYRE